MLTSRVEITVRYAETDMMGIVYHGSYLPWLEVGRTTLLKEQGFPYRELEAAGYHLPLLSVSMKYHQPARYDDTVTVHTRITDRPSLRIGIDYEVRRGDTLLLTARTEHAFVDRQGRPTRPPAEFAAAMARAFVDD